MFRGLSVRTPVNVYIRLVVFETPDKLMLPILRSPGWEGRREGTGCVYEFRQKIVVLPFWEKRWWGGWGPTLLFPL